MRKTRGDAILCQINKIRRGNVWSAHSHTRCSGQGFPVLLMPSRADIIIAICENGETEAQSSNTIFKVIMLLGDKAGFESKQFDLSLCI